MFGKKKNKQKSAPVEELLRAIPVVIPGVEAKKDNKGLFQVRLKLKGIHKQQGSWLKRTFLPVRDQILRLDEIGSAYWGWIDGSRRLMDIERLLREKFEFSKEDCQQAVVTFTADLMRRNFIGLKLPEATEGNRKNADI